MILFKSAPVYRESSTPIIFPDIVKVTFVKSQLALTMCLRCFLKIDLKMQELKEIITSCGLGAEAACFSISSDNYLIKS